MPHYGPAATRPIKITITPTEGAFLRFTNEAQKFSVWQRLARLNALIALECGR